MPSTEQTRAVDAEVRDRPRNASGAREVEGRLTGRTSDRMRAEIAAAGWLLPERQRIR